MSVEHTAAPRTASPTPSGSAPVVEVVDLVKRYPKASTNAVDGISFSVGPGEVLGLLGPNGAGKTTTVGMLTTRVTPTAGQMWLAGVDPAREPTRARSAFGVVPQRVNLDRSLTIERNLLFHAAYHGVPRREARATARMLLERLELGENANSKADFLSGGQAQRVLIARALMHQPRVLFLDEPCTGLDPAARLFVWQQIEHLRDQGISIVLTTHDMLEAERLADRIAIMERGRILVQETPERLVADLDGARTMDVTLEAGAGGWDELLAGLAGVPGLVRVERLGTVAPVAGDTDRETLRVRCYVDKDPTSIVLPMAELLRGSTADLDNIVMGRPTLEDVFLRYTGRTLK